MSFDLLAVQNEADQAPFEFHLGDEGFTLPASFPLFAAEALSEGDPFGAMRILLGDDDYTRLRKVGARSLDATRLEALFTAYQQHLGMEPGESPASTDS